ncbi:unnamed protein product [Durusdinium trenchii]|uniref:DHHA1 domain-containing protein n=1 Tax=Durusdinium trenchii TaxID=1381693 RepID=A0ABP0PNB4_9DINO
MCAWRTFRPLSAGLHYRPASALVVASYVGAREQKESKCWSLWGSYDVGVLAGKEGSLLSSLPLKEKAVIPDQVDMVIFHGNCPDGFAAAFAAYLRRGKDCEYVGIGHGNKRLPANVDGKTIAIVDFSFDKDTMEELRRRAKGVIVLDHHASAQEALATFPEENKVFEMKMSGATLSWDFFHGQFTKQSCPLLFRYIEDKDIWRWTMKRSKEFSAAQELELPIPAPGLLEDPDLAFKPWMQIYKGGERGLDAMLTRGTSIVAYQDSLIKAQARSAKVRRLKAVPDQKAFVVNATVLPSELGNELAKRGVEEGVSYVMCVKYLPGFKPGEGSWSISLRSLFGSNDAAADVSEIARKFGGGGHRAASGCAVRVSNLEELFVTD